MSGNTTTSSSASSARPFKLRPDAPAGVTPTLHVLSLRDGVLSPVALGATDAKIE